MGPLPRRGVVSYSVGYVVYFIAGIGGFIRVVQGHGPGPVVIVSLVASSLLVVAVWWFDIRAGRIESPPGFMEGLRRLRRLGRR